MKTNNYLFLSLCLCIPLFALTGCDNDSSEEPFGTDTERYDIPLDTKSLEVRSSLLIFIRKWLARRSRIFVSLL